MRCSCPKFSQRLRADGVCDDLRRSSLTLLGCFLRVDPEGQTENRAIFYDEALERIDGRTRRRHPSSFKSEAGGNWPSSCESAQIATDLVLRRATIPGRKRLPTRGRPGKAAGRAWGHRSPT